MADSRAAYLAKMYGAPAEDKKKKRKKKKPKVQPQGLQIVDEGVRVPVLLSCATSSFFVFLFRCGLATRLEGE